MNRILLFICSLLLSNMMFAQTSSEQEKLEARKEQINKEIADIATKKFCNHLWYLSEEYAGLALFDERISVEIILKMKKYLLHLE